MFDRRHGAHPQTVGPKILWIQHHFELYRRYMFSRSSSMVYRLTGEYVMDHHGLLLQPLFDLRPVLGARFARPIVLDRFRN
jgi:sugar (pentulose or hexulose) kinase